jgi:hypothetical protein
MQRDQIAEAILRPNAAISQGFQTALVSTTDGGTYVGFVTSRNSSLYDYASIRIPYR